MEELFDKLKKANLNPKWGEEEDFYTNDIEVLTDTADYEISMSAGGYYSVKRSEPFKENEFYAFKNVNSVIALIKADEEE